MLNVWLKKKLPNNEKVVKETPDIETFVTTYFEFPGTFTTNLRSSRKFLRLVLACPLNMMTKSSQMLKIISLPCVLKF